MISAAAALVWASMAGWMVILAARNGMWKQEKRPAGGLGGRATEVSGRASASYRYRPPCKYEALDAHHPAPGSSREINSSRHATLGQERQESVDAARANREAAQHATSGANLDLAAHPLSRKLRKV
jgi:hypothetical protein